MQEAFERYKDEMSDLAETVEIATLDKEMAEEKVSDFDFYVILRTCLLFGIAISW